MSVSNCPLLLSCFPFCILGESLPVGRTASCSKQRRDSDAFSLDGTLGPGSVLLSSVKTKASLGVPAVS